MVLSPSVLLSASLPVVAAAFGLLVLLIAFRGLLPDSPLRLAVAWLAVVLLPAAAGAFLGGRSVIAVFRAMAVTGSGGVGALSAGLVESLLPLRNGLAAAALVALLGLLALLRSRRGPSDAATSGPVYVFAGLGAAVLLVAVAATQRLIAASSTALAVAGGWFETSGSARSVATVAESLAMLLVSVELLAVLAVLASCALLIFARTLAWGRLQAGSPARVLSLALLLAALGWSAATAWRVAEDVSYLERSAMVGKATPRSL